MNVPDDLIVRCHDCGGTQIWKREGSEIHVYHDCFNGKHSRECFAKLEADRDSWRRVCERLEAENAALEAALQAVVDVKNEVQQANAELRKQVERLSAPVTDAEWLMLCAGDEVEETDMQRHDIENFLANRKGAA